MKGNFAVSVAGIVLLTWTLSGCAWFDHHHHDNGLHKGQYKSKAAKKK